VSAPLEARGRKAGVDVRGSIGPRPAKGSGAGRGMGSHSRPNDGGTVEWYTPPGIFAVLGLEFDLDPCSPPGGLPWIPARRFYCEADDGLSQPWAGRVWLNPPYGRLAGAWMRRLAAHGNGIALVFARTETAWWHETVPTCSAVCFIEGRLSFVAADGLPGHSNAGAPSALIAYGEECAAAVAGAGLGMTFAVRSRALGGQASLWE
jgi:hypothetical protein